MNSSTEIRDKSMMQRALAIAREGMTPFGCVIANGDKVVLETPNTVRVSGDPSAHAEMNAIRQLSALGKKTDGLVLYTTGEPCPMCMSAIMYAGIGEVVFAVPWQDIRRFYPQIEISAREVINKGFKEISLRGEVLKEECLALFKNLKP
ncbi:MAG: nucleoside deaminase [Bacteroidales bacterium]|jgi:tRNA(Arg) A34 adenosine deaminase TadA|nr:nucleoside deaminase [Bacteroidales bacterium]NCU34545.1 nucleoside deaminase [Candidatus Falkowbacteria bacterium]MDD3131697.1 nucleoside deaminase [Bacteroidales bacterium]MDD4176240.1 nucleoside deaminase [Bacteroidales bacterium]MDD4740467.1 nucleoside deaminase [Bacteroidales bacterium]